MEEAEEVVEETLHRGEVPPRYGHIESFDKQQKPTIAPKEVSEGNKKYNYLKFFDAFGKVGKRRKEIIKYLFDNEGESSQEDVLKYLKNKFPNPKKHKYWQRNLSNDIKWLKKAEVIRSFDDQRDSRKHVIVLSSFLR